jgi:[ribosomal protein S5]-alanine N-acetyltransferase
MLKMVPALQTSRLLLRPLELTDSSQTQLLFPHWEIVRYLSKVVPWPYPPDGAYRYYSERLCRQWNAKKNGTGRCA